MQQISIVVTIRRTADGAVRVSHDLGYMVDGEFQDFIWSEGNYACDCNRELFWHRAADEPDPDDNACGDSRYEVEIRDTAGRLLYSDDEGVPVSNA